MTLIQSILALVAHVNEEKDIIIQVDSEFVL